MCKKPKNKPFTPAYHMYEMVNYDILLDTLFFVSPYNYVNIGFIYGSATYQHLIYLQKKWVNASTDEVRVDAPESLKGWPYKKQTIVYENF